MAATDAKPIPYKGEAFRVYFGIFDTAGAPVAGAASLDSEVALDGAAFADATNETTEIGLGAYFLDVTSAEMNTDCTALAIQSDKVTSLIFLYPEEIGDIRVNATQIDNSEPAADRVNKVFAAQDQGGVTSATATTIVLSSGQSAQDDFYNGMWIHIHAGTGVGQSRRVPDYDGATGTCTVTPAWGVIPDATSAYVFVPGAGMNEVDLLDLADAIETGVTLRQAHRIALAAAAGKSSGFPGANPVFRNVGDTKNRISATVDSDGNRTAVTLDGS